MVRIRIKLPKFPKLKIAGNLNQGTTLVRPIELKLINYLTPRVPEFISTYHLTISSIFFSIGIIVTAIFTKQNISLFWIGIILNIFQYIADALDGEVGRRRNTGLVKWGFYVDHFLDYVFMCSIFVSHMIIWPNDILVFALVMAVIGAYFVHEALTCVTSGKYNVRGYYLIGGTEIRLLLVIIDVIAVILKLQSIAIPFILMIPIFLLTLARQVNLNQRKLWQQEFRK